MKIPFPNLDTVTLHYGYKYVRFPDHIEDFIKENSIKISFSIRNFKECPASMDPSKFGKYEKQIAHTVRKKAMASLVNYWFQHEDEDVLLALKMMW